MTLAMMLSVGLAWRDPELMRMKPPRPLLETPAFPDLAGMGIGGRCFSGFTGSFSTLN